MGFRSFKEIIDANRKMKKRRLCVASAEDKAVLESVKLAGQESLNLEFTLVGDREEINHISREISLSTAGMKIIHASIKEEALPLAVEEVARGNADFLMKGLVSTKDFLYEVLKEHHGLRTGRILSHVAALEVPNYPRILFITDGGINLYPDFQEKVQILNNGVEFLHDLGIKEPRVAVLAVVETVDPKMAATQDAANLSKMEDRGQIKGARVEGPLGLDNAVDAEAAAYKGLSGPVAGNADMLLAPNIESGNFSAKTITFLSGGAMAGIVLGARVPVLVTSRADSVRSKMISMALGAMAASRENK